MLIGYMRVSKADGSQVLDMQRDALLAAGIRAEHLYDDLASGSVVGKPRGSIPRIYQQFQSLASNRIGKVCLNVPINTQPQISPNGLMRFI